MNNLLPNHDAIVQSQAYGFADLDTNMIFRHPVIVTHKSGEIKTWELRVLYQALQNLLAWKGHTYNGDFDQLKNATAITFDDNLKKRIDRACNPGDYSHVLTAQFYGELRTYPPECRYEDYNNENDLFQEALNIISIHQRHNSNRLANTVTTTAIFTLALSFFSQVAREHPLATFLCSFFTVGLLDNTIRIKYLNQYNIVTLPVKATRDTLHATKEGLYSACNKAGGFFSKTASLLRNRFTSPYDEQAFRLDN